MRHARSPSLYTPIEGIVEHGKMLNFHKHNKTHDLRAISIKKWLGITSYKETYSIGIIVKKKGILLPTANFNHSKQPRNDERITIVSVFFWALARASEYECKTFPTRVYKFSVFQGALNA